MDTKTAHWIIQTLYDVLGDQLGVEFEVSFKEDDGKDEVQRIQNVS